ncbi:MAG: 2-hydroxyacyl-CoA dehydratase [Planctomycetes bacterium]|nr:2-hydroxyacyl-CoA dehydratase [Planctomycetota bacterium]
MTEPTLGPPVSPDATLDGILERCRSLAGDPSLEAVSRWKGEHPGALAIGLFPVYAPAELVEAVGGLPVPLRGGGGRIELERADARMQSFVCSITRSTLELGLSGRLAALDGVIFPSICDAARNLSGIFRRNFPSLLVEYLHLPSNAASRVAVDYGRGEFSRLLGKLEARAGRRATEEDLARAIVAGNEHRDLVRRLYALRREDPGRISSLESWVLLRAGDVLPRGEHAATLRRALDLLPRRATRPRDRIRVLLHGAFCEQPPLELLATLEEAGCEVVGDDLLLGTRWLRAPVRAGGDPLGALAEAYLRDSTPSAVRHGTTESKGEAILEAVSRCRADGVVFATAKFCEPGLFDLVLEKRVLDRAGVPSLAFEFEERMGAFESIRTQVETFVESLLLFGGERPVPERAGRRP